MALADSETTPPDLEACGNPDIGKPNRFKTDIDIIKARENASVKRPEPGTNEAVETQASGDSQQAEKRPPISPRQSGKQQTEGGHEQGQHVGPQSKRSLRSDQKRKSDWKYSNESRSKTSRAPRDEQAQGPSHEPPTPGNEKRLPKRKVALLFGYYGKGYQGSQVNPGMKTIEGEVFKALVQAGCISEDNSAHPNKVGLQRAARTDANVHAGCNLISLKLILEPPLMSQNLEVPKSSAKELESASENVTSTDKLIQHINLFLPSEIRIWKIIRVQNSFQSRSLCDSRTYEYSLPTYLFLPPQPGTPLYAKLNKNVFGDRKQKWAEVFEEGESEASWWNEHPKFEKPSQQQNCTTSTFQASLLEKKSSHRISPPMINRIKESIEQFRGTHNFHNFTVGKEFKERNSIRIMRKLSVSDPFIVSNDRVKSGTEWITIQFYGQSFMLHQIRKMVALVILMCRTRTPAGLIAELYGPAKVRIPKAPGSGLILHCPHFDGYNKRVLEANRQISQKNNTTEPEQQDLLYREPIDPEGSMLLIEKFKQEILYRKMWEEENQENAFGAWIHYLDCNPEPDLNFLNPAGVLPPSMINPRMISKKSGTSSSSKNSEMKHMCQENDEEEKTLMTNGDEMEEG